MTTPADNISCGIAGWSYKDWDGYVYPPGVKDQLHYVARYVDMIEVNSTFYHPPSARMAQSWVARTAELERFFFTAKLHQDITHKGRIEPQMVAEFHSGLGPMVRAGKLKHLLAQFRYDFADTDDARRHLAAIRERFGDMANVVLELRHRSWQAPEALDYLRSIDVSVANLDYPMAKDSFNMPKCTIGSDAYLRLHGRNAKAWFDRKAGRDETYNYYYSARELDEIAARAVEISAASGSLTLVANNHYQGKEVANSLQLKALTTGKKVDVPPLLAERYPDLKRIAK